jgi:glycosyltransferase involved in cell wall biosynthesis
VRQALTGAAALFFPSMREAAGWVVAEALAVGCPVVCLNVGGPPLLIGAQGIAVDPGPALPARLAEALASVPTLGRTVVRWDETALSPLLTEWYSMAAAPARLDAAPA